MKKALIFILIIISLLFVAILIQDEYGCAGENRDECLLQKIERGEDDERICGEITTIENRNICYFTLAQKRGIEGTELCHRLNSSGTLSQDYCYYSLALSQRESSICEQLSSPEQKRLCIQSLTMVQS